MAVAAFHDDRTDEYLVQKYSVGLIPSINLVDTRYRNIQNSPVLAVGAAQFTPDQDQIELPVVGIEVPLIVSQRGGEIILDNQFTVANFNQALQTKQYSIVHIASHGNFQSKVPEEIYLQFYDRKLSPEVFQFLGEFQELDLHNLDLMVFSIERSGLGDKTWPFGFAGLALQAGAKSALASLWDISDTGTLAFMSNFYEQLKVAPIKAEAVRQTQIAMIENQLRKEGSQIISSTGNVPLPEDLLHENVDLSHPFYWAAFTIVGSPW